MTTPIGSTSSPATAAPAGGPDAAQTAQFEMLLGQNMMMRMQQNHQAMTKSMNKMTETIKQSMQDEE